MLTSHDIYCAAHARLFEVANKDNATCFSVASTLINHKLNNSLIWKELRYYKQHGKILGEHAVFERRMRWNILEEMNLAELKQERERNRRSIAYYKKQLKEQLSSDKRGEWATRINELNTEQKKIAQLISKQTNGTKRRTKTAIKTKGRRR